MRIEEMKAIAAKRTALPWSLTPIDSDIPEDGVIVIGSPSMSWPRGYPIAEQIDENNAEFIVMAANHIHRLIAVAEAAQTYEKWLPNMEPIGAAKHSAMLIAAMELRKRIKELEGKE